MENPDCYACKVMWRVFFGVLFVSSVAPVLLALIVFLWFRR